MLLKVLFIGQKSVFIQIILRTCLRRCESHIDANCPQGLMEHFFPESKFASKLVVIQVNSNIINHRLKKKKKGKQENTKMSLRNNSMIY